MDAHATNSEKTAARLKACRGHAHKIRTGGAPARSRAPKSLSGGHGNAAKPRNVRRPYCLLDVFCGRGGWSRGFVARGWHCIGVDIADFSRHYPGTFYQLDALTLTESDHFGQFDAAVVSPPCEEFARAWLPWLRGDKQPAESAVQLLRWAIEVSQRGPRRIVECSRFAANHVTQAPVRVGSWCLWGDVPMLLPELARRKTAQSGKVASRRALIPFGLSVAVCDWFTASLELSQVRSHLGELTVKGGEIR